MVQQVRAFGQIIQFPDGMSDDDIASAIRDNEHTLNPNFKNPEGFSGLAKNVLTGAKQTGRMLGSSVDAYGNNLSGVEDYAKRSDVSRQQNTPVEQRKLQDQLAGIDRNTGVMDQIGETLSTAARNPMGTAQMITEQLPNTAVSLGGGYAGLKAGAAAGAFFGPIGATVGGTLGFLGGMFLGNVMLETGGKAIEKASDGDGFTPEERNAAVEEGAKKAAVITGVDAATLKLGGMLANRLGRPAIDAGARAEAKTLIDAGVDMTSASTINAALRSSPELFKQAKVAGERAAMQSMSTKRKAGMIGSGVALETAGEGVGEYAGEQFATGNGDVVDATIEALSSATQSMFETAYNYNKVASGNDMSMSGIRKAADSINKSDLEEGLSNISKSQSVDEAIKAANEVVSSKPVTTDDLLKSIDPSLDDIERLTGLRPTEAVAQVQQPAEVPNEETKIAKQETSGSEKTGVLGSSTEITLPDGTRLPAQWKVVDADQVKASVKEGVNQPRDRTRAASDIQIQGIASNPDYSRLSDSPVMDVGSPTLSHDGLIVGGNGRFEGISRAHESGTSEKYRESLLKDSLSKGIDPSLYQGMKKPVLVRQITEPFDTRSLAIASNSGSSLQYSGLELAKIDSERMSGINDLDISDDGDIPLTSANIRKIADSLSKYTPAEQAGFIDSAGNLSQDGLRRVRNTIMFNAYGNTPTLSRMVESTDGDMRNIVGVLMKVAGNVAKVRNDIKQGAIPKELDVTDDLIGSVEKLSQLKATGQTVDTYLAQQSMFGEDLSDSAKEILKYVSDNIRSQKKITEFIRDIYDSIAKVDTITADIFGDAKLPNKEEVIRNAKQSKESKGQQQGIFERPADKPREETRPKPETDGNNAESDKRQGSTNKTDQIYVNLKLHDRNGKEVIWKGAKDKHPGRTRADTALKEVDDRINLIKQLQGCLG